MQNDNPEKKSTPESGQLDISEYIPGHDLKSKPADKPKKKKSRLNQIELIAGKLMGVLVVGGVCFGLWGVGSIFITMGSVHRDFYLSSWMVFVLGIFVLIYGFLFYNKRIVRRISCGMMLLSILCSIAFYAWTWWTVDRFPVMEQDVDWWQYRPFVEGNKLVRVEVPLEYTLNPDRSFPRLNGAYALYPIYAAMAQGLYPRDIAQQYNQIRTDGSDVIYDELLKGERDLIFALAPSKKQAEEAEQAGVEYELTPFCMDAFVFFVNADNPVDNLTTEQIRGIYSGRITDWKEVGAPESTKIVPFQRNEGSGSQTTLQKLMGDTPIMPPLKEDRLGGMGEIINDTANYRNYRAALGFSFRYYSTELLRNDQIKLLSIDGVAPTVENIRDGSYPLVATAYIVTVKPRSENVRKIVDFMLSPEGQRLVEETGYVPVGPASEE